MKITYNNVTIDFFNFEFPTNQFALSLSGGLDSAALMYLICKHFPQIEIIPFTCRDVNAPKDADAAAKIVEWMRNEFPNMKILDHQIFNFNDRDESIITWGYCDLVINSTPRYSKLNRTQMSKILQIDKIARTVMAQYPNCIRLDSMTCNPPKEDMIKEPVFYEKSESRRDAGEHRQELRLYYNDPHGSVLSNIYQAFINVDKKFVADVYKQNGLMDTLYPIARSCVGTERKTDNYTRECHECFWCYEKKWAFNLTW
jgi:hypothetical protein